MLPFRVVSIHGAPRSGTSWLGQIFNCHSEVAYRYQPFFSYRFKGTIDIKSSRAEIDKFLKELYAVDSDDFILQTQQKLRGVHPADIFKVGCPSVLVMKEVRYHYLIETLLRLVKGIKVVGVVRHPCGVINSWQKTPREFNVEWDILTEWNGAPSKNKGRPEEYYGFARWKELTNLFLRLEEKYPDSFYLVRYERLVAQPEAEVGELFDFCGLDMSSKIKEFLSLSQLHEIDDPDTVFRCPDVVARWEQELCPEVRDAILKEIASSNLKDFI